MRMVDRYRFLFSLIDGIKDKSKVHDHEGVVSFTETEDGVTVRTEQGNVYEGSILVGADGVHSEVRKQMAALTDDPKRHKTLTNGFVTRCKSHVLCVSRSQNSTDVTRSSGVVSHPGASEFSER